MKRYLGIDIGGTTTKFGLFCENGQLEEKWEQKTRIGDNGVHIIPDIAAAAAEKMEELKKRNREIVAAGMGIPGPMNDAGYVERCVNLNWNNCAPAAGLERLLSIPVFAGNDANVAALGEQWQGAGKDFRNVFLITLGTGVGGGMIADGRIVNGRGGMAGEIGHVSVNPDEVLRCNCGNRGCLDQMASATGIVRNALRLLEQSEEDSVLRTVAHPSARDVADAASAGDALALAALDYCFGFLGKALSIVSHVSGPDLFIIGGGVSGMGELLIRLVERHYRQNMYLSADYAEIRLATLGNDAGIYGAARMAMQNSGV